MSNKKNTRRARPEPKRSTGDSTRSSANDRRAPQFVVKPIARKMDTRALEDFRKHVERQTLLAFLDAVNVWGLNDADSARLVGVEPATVQSWKTGKAPTNEEILARMTMVALIRTALDIVFSPSLSSEWMTLPNSGYPYSGLSPVAYVAEHGWPGLFWVLRQSQGRAVGN